jgi:hypothetical protein
MKHITTKYPAYIDEVSEIIGLLRNKSNEQIMNNNSYYQRGGLEDKMDIMGVKGELIVSNYLHSQGIEHKLSKLLDDRPVSSEDINIDGKAVDVKCVNDNAPHLLVNEKAHLKDKGIGYYAFVMPKPDHTAHIWLCSYEDVSKWNVRNFKYTNAYYKQIDYGNY